MKAEYFTVSVNSRMSGCDNLKEFQFETREEALAKAEELDPDYPYNSITVLHITGRGGNMLKYYPRDRREVRLVLGVY